MSKHTKGPWRLGPDMAGDMLTVWGAQPGMSITSVFDSRLGSDAPPMREAKANALLIAAAPEMLEALRLLHAHLFGPAPEMPRHEIDAMCRAAIAKAEGRS